METAESVINDILQEVLIQASEQPIESVDFQFCLRYMNRYMTQLSVTNPLGYTSVSLPTDAITIPDGAINGLIYNTALQILNSYDVQPSLTLIQNADESLKVIRKLSRNLQATQLPSTLPIGSGNECGILTGRFYPEDPQAITTEQNGVITTEQSQ